MQKVLLLFTSALVLLVFTFSSYPTKEKVHWMTIAEVQAAYKKEPRPILMDVYTNWCGWCKVMDKETYNHDKVSAYINEKYYAVKFDAESKEPVEWNGKTFVYNQANKVNELAVHLMFGQMSYPTTIFLSELTGRPAPLAGYLKPKDMESPLKYFGEGAYKSGNFPDFMKTFKSSW